MKKPTPKKAAKKAPKKPARKRARSPGSMHKISRALHRAAKAPLLAPEHMLRSWSDGMIAKSGAQRAR
jgi:hypothetical protein